MSTPTAVDETERERLIVQLARVHSQYWKEWVGDAASEAINLLRADAAEIAALRKDAERLNKIIAEWTGCQPEDLEAALRTSPPDEQRGTK